VKRAITPLLLIFLIQCGITAAVYGPVSGLMGRPDVRPLASFDPGWVDALYIIDENDNEAVLVKTGGRWHLPELAGLPADTARIKGLLTAISSNEHGWAVARTAAARQRFQVANYHYRRRLTLIGQGEVLATIYLGTSPGFRKVHARNDNQDAIYSVALNTFDTPSANGAWLDRKLLQIRAPMQITADGYSLHRGGGNWRLGTGKVPDSRELDALLTALRTLQVERIAGADIQRDLSQMEAELILQVQSLAGESTLELFSMEEQHYIHSSEYKLFFRLSAYDYDRLTGIDALLLSGEAP
jgi:hypothetical protein